MGIADIIQDHLNDIGATRLLSPAEKESAAMVELAKRKVAVTAAHRDNTGRVWIEVEITWEQRAMLHECKRVIAAPGSLGDGAHVRGYRRYSLKDMRWGFDRATGGNIGAALLLLVERDSGNGVGPDDFFGGHLLTIDDGSVAIAASGHLKIEGASAVAPAAPAPAAAPVPITQHPPGAFA